MKRTLAMALSIATLSSFALSARAASVNISDLVQGALDNFGDNNATYNGGPGNVITGRLVTGGGTAFFNSYFVFDLSALSGNVTSAQITMTLPFNEIISPFPSETLGLFDVNNSNIAALINQNTSGNTGAFNDLQSGTTYGSRVFTSADSGTSITITLNSDALAAITADEGGKFAIGGTLTSLDPSNIREQIFAFTGNDTDTTLVLNAAPVPLPAAAPAGFALFVLIAGSSLLRKSKSPSQ